MTGPKLSLLLVVYNMQREAPRTIASALPPYQKGIEGSDYEVLILENGSTEPLSPDYCGSLPGNVRVIRAPKEGLSPGEVLNWAVELSSADVLMFCIDGARILSERLIADSLSLVERYPGAFVYTLSWHLGPDVQMRSMMQGYNQAVEDALLDKAAWYSQPDSLFEVSVLAGSSQAGLLGPIAESNAFTMHRDLYKAVGGYDPRFRLPGGSTSNLELFTRYVTRPDALNICLLSAATFHQFHGGAATGQPGAGGSMFQEYEQIMGCSYKPPLYDPLFFGWPSPAALLALARSSKRPR
jgi:glycosyltransferase involved in cell wall biosynthesis